MLFVQRREGDSKDAAPSMFPMPAQDRQRVQSTDEGFPLRRLLRPNASADHRRSRGGELTRETDNSLGLESAYLRDSFRRPRRDLGGEVIEVRAGSARKVEVRQPLLEHHARHAGRKDRIRPGAKLDVLFALARRTGADRVDADDACAVASARLLNEVPMVVACGEKVAAPKQDEAAVGELPRGRNRTAVLPRL